MTSDTCSGCGKPVYWGMTADGKRIAIDALAPVYAIFERVTQEGQVYALQLTRTSLAAVSHAETCRNKPGVH